MKNFEKYVGGMIPSKFDPRDYRVNRGAKKATYLPKEYKPNLLKKIHDQGQFSNCATHALSTYIEILFNKNNKNIDMSFPWFYGDRNYSSHKGKGTITRDLLKAAQKDGGLYFNNYPYIEEMPQALNTFNTKFNSLKSESSKLKINNYYYCDSIEEVKEAIYKYGSCLVGTLLFKSFSNVAEGKTLYMNEPLIKDGSLEDIVGGHMMIAVGWTEKYLIIQNSWGTDFGEKGFFYMPFSLATWNQRTGFPISVFEAWAIDGVTLDGKLITFQKNSNPMPPEPSDPKNPEKEVSGWYKDENGKYRYKLPNGQDAIGWQQIDNEWYFFNNKKEMMTNYWTMARYKWYYMKSNGAMAKNQWLKIDNRWYWFDIDGHAVTGFKTIQGKNYFFAKKGFQNIKECQLLMTDSSGALI